MNAKLSKFLSYALAVPLLLGAATFGTLDATAGEKHRRELRRHDGEGLRHAAVERDVRRHERDRRAFIAGAAAQQHREDNRNYYRNDLRDGGYRGGYDERYRDRYYRDDDDDDNKIGAALVGAAVGAVITGVVMSNSNNSSSSSSTSSSNDSK